MEEGPQKIATSNPVQHVVEMGTVVVGMHQ